MGRTEPLLCGDRATSARRRDRIAVLTDAHCHVTDVYRDLAGLAVSQCLRQRPYVIVSEAQCLDLGELRVFRKRGQGHSQTLEGVVQRMHSVTLAIVRLYSTIPFQLEYLKRRRKKFRSVWNNGNDDVTMGDAFG